MSDPLEAHLRRMTLAVQRGEPLPRLPEAEAAALGAVGQALGGFLAAVAAREGAERQQLANPSQDVQLALEELAREQAAELSQQNDELRQQNAELTRAGRLKDEFLATVSHELRTPLNAVIGFAELLLEEGSGDLRADQAEYVTDIHRAGRHLLGMINDLLDLARFDAGRLDFKTERFDLRAPLREAEEIARSLAMRKSLQFELRADEQVPCVGDPNRVRQLALNLISNAVKFTPQGGSVIATVRRGAQFAELEVKDSGIGVDPSNHALIFEAFRQVDGSDTREHQGTGLGLALVKKFAEAMRGEVSLQSALGQGSTFTVRLPLGLEDAPGEKPRVVLCDRLGEGAPLRPTLEALGFEVSPFAQAEALRLTAIPQLVICDLLPAPAALAAIRRVQDLAGRRVPSVAIVSAQSSAADLDPLTLAGAQVLLSGAGQAEALVARLEDVRRAHNRRLDRTRHSL